MAGHRAPAQGHGLHSLEAILTSPRKEIVDTALFFFSVHVFLFLVRYEVFTGRCLLAVLDHNFHLFRKEIQGKFKKLYSRRSGNWRVEAVKEDKSYSYWPALIADIYYVREPRTQKL